MARISRKALDSVQGAAVWLASLKFSHRYGTRGDDRCDVKIGSAR